jgi:ABC-type Mn2+/Zn2+ transport system ATPase subunit
VIVFRTEGVRVRFADGTVVALPDVAIETGARVAVLGANGTGKTTLLRVLAFLETPEGGFSAAVPAAAIGFVAQRPFLLRGTVTANLMLAARRLPRSSRTGAVADALARVGASHLARRARVALSAGELQRVAIARALVGRPRVLLLDEVVAPLDADGVRRLRETLAALDDVTVIAAAPGPDGVPFEAGAHVVRLDGARRLHSVPSRS